METKKAKKPATVKQVKALINNSLDKNYADNTPLIAPAAITTAGRIIASLPALGESERLLKYDVRYSVKLPYVAGQTNCISRVILFQWKDVTTPTVADILKSADVHAHYLNHQSNKRVKVISDRMYRNQEVSESATNTAHLSFSKKHFNDIVLTTGAAAAQNIYFLVISTSATATFECKGGNTFIKI